MGQGVVCNLCLVSCLCGLVLQFDALVEARLGPDPYAALFQYVHANFKGTADHVLARQREEHAVYAAACIACGFCVLLEGPAAVGKSSLVTALAACWDGGRRWDGSIRQVCSHCSVPRCSVILWLLFAIQFCQCRLVSPCHLLPACSWSG